MAENAPELKMDDGVKKELKFGDWSLHKEMVAAGLSCDIEVGKPKIGLRFFLRPKEQMITVLQGQYPILKKWYCLCAEVLSQVNENNAVRVTASLYSPKTQLLYTKVGVIPLYKSKGKVFEAIDHFIYFESSTLSNIGEIGIPNSTNTMYVNGSHRQLDDVTISIMAQLARLTGNDKEVDPLDTAVEKSAEAEKSLIHDLKNLFVAHENYADIKLESRDHMTLDAHKFILAARSRYLQKCIDDAMKVENFNGTMKMDINGKPLVAVLHWMYTGELHENSGNVMEELVNAAILFELTHLMKLLDEKLVTICNKENMFRLYQVAQKNGMPNAMDDISVYIREHL